MIKWKGSYVYLWNIKLLEWYRWFIWYLYIRDIDNNIKVNIINYYNTLIYRLEKSNKDMSK